jgi:hypothetical protein
MTDTNHDPSFEETVEFLKTSAYNRPLITELTLRRESALEQLTSAEGEREVFKQVGRIDAFDDLIATLQTE